MHGSRALLFGITALLLLGTTDVTHAKRVAGQHAVSRAKRQLRRTQRMGPIKLVARTTGRAVLGAAFGGAAALALGTVVPQAGNFALQAAVGGAAIVGGVSALRSTASLLTQSKRTFAEASLAAADRPMRARWLRAAGIVRRTAEYGAIGAAAGFAYGVWTGPAAIATATTGLAVGLGAGLGAGVWKGIVAPMLRHAWTNNRISAAERALRRLSAKPDNAKALGRFANKHSAMHAAINNAPAITAGQHARANRLDVAMAKMTNASTQTTR